MSRNNKNFKVLLVEDDLSLLKGLQYTLEKQDFIVDPTTSLHHSRILLNEKNFDLVLLDISLPDGSGFDFCREIRKTSDIPVIFLTACDEEVNIVMGLDIGGDDYITKPFRVNELVSRINAVLRRRHIEPEKSPLIKTGDFTLDKNNSKILKNNTPLILTSTEYRLIQILISNKGNIVTRKKLVELLWDSEGHFVDSNTLSVYIRRLREKVEDNPESPVNIKTIRGLGYQWL